MNLIKSILEDFIACSKLPALAIDNNFQEIYQANFDEYAKAIYVNCDIKNEIIYKLNELKYLHLDFGDYKNFLVIPISKFDNYKGYYVIYLHNLPNHCIPYIHTLISNISDEKHNDGKCNLCVNLYIKKAIEYCLKHYSEEINIDCICEHLQINKSYFCKLFKKEVGVTFCKFLNNLRVEKSKYFLLNTDMSLLDIAINVGFNSQSYYSMIFKKYIGKSPIEYRNTNLI